MKQICKGLNEQKKTVVKQTPSNTNGPNCEIEHGKHYKRDEEKAIGTEKERAHRSDRSRTDEQDKRFPR